MAAVAQVYHSLTPAEQAKAAIFCDNYGEAAAIDFFGRQYGLPKAISGHQNYLLWGPRNYTGEIVILVGGDEEDARKEFASVAIGATLHKWLFARRPSPGRESYPPAAGSRASSVPVGDAMLDTSAMFVLTSPSRLPPVCSPAGIAAG